MNLARGKLVFILAIMVMVGPVLLACTTPYPLTPQIWVTFPNGGETVTVINGTMAVTWTSLNISESEMVVIQISGDSGKAWKTVRYHSNTGGCACPAPANATQHGRVKVSCFVEGVGVVSDTSDGDFITNQAGAGIYSYDYYTEYWNYAPPPGLPPEPPPVDIFTKPPDAYMMEFAVDCDLGDGAPAGLPGVIQSDFFAARRRGIFHFDEGCYTFTATVDGGVRVYLDGELIIDKWKPQVATTYEVTKSVFEGDHQVKVEYFGPKGITGIGVQVDWQTQVMAWWWDSNGVRWYSVKQRVTYDTNTDDKPSIIETPTLGPFQVFTKWIFWQSNRYGTNEIFYAGSVDRSGAKWTGAMRLTDLSYYNYRPASAIVKEATSYSLWAVWGSLRPGSDYYDIFYDYFHESQPSCWKWEYQGTDGNKLVPDGWDASGSDQDPSVTQTSNGDIWIAWSSNVDDDYEIYLAYSTDFGSTWPEVFKITDNTDIDDMYPSITRTIDDSNNEYIWIAWHSNEDGDDEIYYTEFDPISYSWVSPTQLTQNTVSDQHPTIMQTKDGKKWIAWDEWTTANDFEVYYTFTSDCGKSWSTPVDITNNSYVDQTPWLTQTWDGRVWVAWATNRDGNFEIYAMWGIP